MVALPLVALLALAGLPLAGCGGSPSAGTPDTLQISASFYPLQYVVEQVAAEHAEVTNLTKPGAEPHDLELTPADVAGITEADLVVYLAHFQPAVDDAVAAEADPTRVLDVADSARLVEADEATHAAEGAEHEDGHDHGTLDPHFWLDPTRLADVGTAVAQRLADLDPDNAADYEANAAELATALTDLDSQYRQGLADCQSRDLVTSHEAFGYLARAYGLTQRGISGLSPEQEPTPQQLADAAAFVAANKVTTIYYETLISPDIAKTVATETGAATAVLDPIEGLSESSAGEDYLQVMATNLQTLREGQQCR